MKSEDIKFGNFKEELGALEIERLLRAIGSAKQKGKIGKRDNLYYIKRHSEFDDESTAHEVDACGTDSYSIPSTSLALGEYDRKHGFTSKGDFRMEEKTTESKHCDMTEVVEDKKGSISAFIEDIILNKDRVEPEPEDPKPMPQAQLSHHGDGKSDNNKIFGLDDDLDENAALYVAALHCLPKVGAQTARKIINEVQSAKIAWRLMYDEDIRNALLEDEMIMSIEKHCIGRTEAEHIFNNLQRDLNIHKIGLLSYLDPEFPRQLENIYNPPAILFYKGNVDLLRESRKSVAMVGARVCSTYGRQVAHTFAKYFSEQGVIVISGGARGIDTQAHQGALDAKCMPTIVIMGCGLAISYPWDNKQLFDSILANRGLLLSEYPPYVPANAKNFPMRNRLISGLARATIVVEAKKSSGSLITADMATNDGRDVYTIPGNVLNHFADGNHWLLRMGAIPLTHPKYLLEDYGWDGENPMDSEYAADYQAGSSSEDTLCQYLSMSEAVSIDDLMHKTDLTREKIYDILLKLELKGLVKRVNAQSYVLVAHLS